MDMRKQQHQNPVAVREARQRAEITQQQLADRVGCSKSLISEIESGTRNAGPERLRLIAKVCKVPVSTLRAPREPRGTATTPTAQGVRELRSEERAEPDELPELRGGSVGIGGGM